MPSTLDKYLHVNRLPHIWCAGCGVGTVVGAFLRAAEQLEFRKENTVVVGGIGCSSRAVGYIDFGTVHAMHGRALAVATGIKMARPDLHVVVITGDGDGAAIGGNHLIHACRRNLDMTTILLNNRIYGMTGGQVSPLTREGEHGTTAPYGQPERPFDISALAQAAGATYVARAVASDPRQLQRLIREGIKHRGFSFIEAVVQCPTEFGRRNPPGDAVSMVNYLKSHAVPVSKADGLTPEERKDAILTGLLHEDNETPEYGDVYAALARRAMEASND